MLALLREPRFVDLAPAEVYATLLDEGVYHCSNRTMYRLLAEHGEVRDRRDQFRHPVYPKARIAGQGPKRGLGLSNLVSGNSALWSFIHPGRT